MSAQIYFTQGVVVQPNNWLQSTRSDGLITIKNMGPERVFISQQSSSSPVLSTNGFPLDPGESVDIKGDVYNNPFQTVITSAGAACEVWIAG